MKIKSRFKDYYDFVQHIYGGGDEKVVYNRDRIKPISDNGFETRIEYPTQKIPGCQFDIPNLRNKIEFKWLVVCSKLYLLVGYKKEIGFTEFHVLNEKSDPDIYKWLDACLKVRSYNPWNTRVRTIDDLLGRHVDELTLVAKELKQPVFIINSVYHREIVIDSRIPVLDDLGFGSIIKPELLYQELAYYISNVMSDNPDTIVPVQIEDKYKITQAGFDLKQSFRHRK